VNRPEMSKQSVIASCLGQMTLSTENAQAAGVMFGLDQAERRPVQTHRGFTTDRRAHRARDRCRAPGIDHDTPRVSPDEEVLS